MTFTPLQTVKQTSTNTASGTPLPQRAALPSIGESRIRIQIESGSPTAVYFCFGDSGVTASSSNGVLVKQSEFPIILGIPPLSTHFSFLASNAIITLNISYGEEV